MKNLFTILFIACSWDLFGQSRAVTELWLESDSGEKLNGVFNFKKQPAVQDTIALDKILSIKIVSENKKAIVKYIMVYQFRNGKDVFIGESDDKTHIPLKQYSPQKGDLFVIQIALKDKMEKQFCFLVE